MTARDLHNPDLATRLEELAGRVTPGPWQGYSEPDVNLPYSLFAGIPMESGFGPIEPLGAPDIDLICLLRNNLPDIIAALRAGEKMREVARLALPTPPAKETPND